MKRIISLLVALVILCALPLHAQARTAEYFKLIPSNNRMSSEGRFIINCYSNYRTDSNFIATHYTIPLTVSAQVYNQDPNTPPKDADNIYYTIELYKVGIPDRVGWYTHAANGETGSTNFTVSIGSEYYLKIVITGNLGSWEYVYGEGDISNMYIVPKRD